MRPMWLIVIKDFLIVLAMLYWLVVKKMFSVSQTIACISTVFGIIIDAVFRRGNIRFDLMNTFV